MMADTNQIKIFLNSEVENALLSYLNAKGLKENTVSKYVEFFEKFANVHGELNQENIDGFLKYNNNSPARAMLRNLFTVIIRSGFPQEIAGFVSKLDVPTRTGTKEKKLPLHMTYKELEYLMKNMKGNSITNERDRLAILTQWWGGLRINELLGITKDDLEIKNYDPSKDFQKIKIKGKGGKERYCYVPKDVYYRITQYIVKRMQISDSFNQRIESKGNVWGFGKSAYSKLLNKKTRQILGRHYNTHSLRHGRGTDLIKKGKSLEYIKKFLGHKDISSTQVYVHLSDEDVEKGLK